MKWFGPYSEHGAPNSEVPRAQTPVGETCPGCHKMFFPQDCGVLIPHLDEDGDWERPWHVACLRHHLQLDPQSDTTEETP